MTAKEFLDNEIFLPDDKFVFSEIDYWYCAYRAKGIDRMDEYIRLVKCFIYTDDPVERNRRLSAFECAAIRMRDFSLYKSKPVAYVDRALERAGIIDGVRRIFYTPAAVRLNVRSWENDPFINRLAGINIVPALEPGRRIYKKGGYSFYVDELCDIEYERAELVREKEKTEADISYLKSFLLDEGFLCKAPLEVIEKRRYELDEKNETLKGIDFRLKILQ